jgi:diketogulonate reductase-like aldo/keto reductase
MTRSAIVKFCQEHKIALEVTSNATFEYGLGYSSFQAWAPLVRGLRFDHPSIVSFARKYNKEPAQVLLRYCLQKVTFATSFALPY